MIFLPQEKFCGFAGHSASMGCSKCLKRFPSLLNKLDYSGYDRTHWNPRTIEDHKFQTTEFLAASTKAKQSEVIKKYGVCYSILLLLPYFNIVRFHVIYAMHNLLLGSAKHVTWVWCDSSILCTKNLQKIQVTINSLVVPVDIGRIPSKISSSYSGFATDQWHNWTCICSPVALKNGLISPADLRCWLLFVKATSMLCTRIITLDDVEVADRYLQLFLSGI